MLKKIFFIFLFTLSGCFYIRTNSIPEDDYNPYYPTTNQEKYEITYSISYIKNLGDLPIYSVTSYEHLKENVEEILNNSQLFNKVQYSSFDEMSNFHFHFEIKVSGSENYQSRAYWEYLQITSLYLIPSGYIYNVDYSLHIFKNKKEVYSLTAPFTLKKFSWLPFALFWPFLNNRDLEKDAVEYFITQIIKDECYK